MQNYVFFLCLYKWWNTFKTKELKIESTERCDKLASSEVTTEEEMEEFNKSILKLETDHKQDWDRFRLGFYSLLGANLVLDLTVMIA